jgi:CBS-domain-containing membrane protein
MAAYTQGRRLEQVVIGDVMSTSVSTCLATEPVEKASAHMRDARVRRLPVVDEEHQIVGLVSLCDLAREGHGEKRPRKRGQAAEDILDTMASIARQRPRRDGLVADPTVFAEPAAVEAAAIP